MLSQTNIYRDETQRRGPARPRATAVSPTEPPNAPKISAADSVAPQAPSQSSPREAHWLETTLLEILRAAPTLDETVAIAFQRKEAAIVELCATLTPIESMQLGRRLERAKQGDELAAAFSRLIVERRQRIIQFLGDARRRAALAGRK